MAVLIQRAEGVQYGRYFFPTLAGVAFSRNPFRWNSNIRREDGFLRLVWGYGTRAVDRVSNDYPRMIALSHPQLRPETTAKAIRQYSQWYTDIIDLEDNTFQTLPVSDVLGVDYPHLRYIASIDQGTTCKTSSRLGSVSQDDQFVLTFNYLTKDKQFIQLFRTALQRLEANYGRPVDVEFTVEIVPNYPQPEYRLHVLQCRPLSERAENRSVRDSQRTSRPTKSCSPRIIWCPMAERRAFATSSMSIRTAYYHIPDPVVRQELGRAIGRLNKRLEGERFILMGPGRWGSVNIDLGVHVTYGDIYNTQVLVEMAIAHDGLMPELSYGTHFFQDLVEAASSPWHFTCRVTKTRLIGRFSRKRTERTCRSCFQTTATWRPYLKVIDLAAIARQSGPGCADERRH